MRKTNFTRCVSIFGVKANGKGALRAHKKFNAKKKKKKKNWRRGEQLLMKIINF